ncbi:MAG: GAF domain-containing protein [Chloroflexota bacterium]|jgi:serine phosphatase RsbU (regulator of sigma subunit)/putative methionine-R-sulfoxide reductase with GAF domain
MSSTRQKAKPDWKQFLRFGEALLNHQTTTDQCATIREWIQLNLAACSEIWLAKPYYPLPGENEALILPSDAAAEILSESHRQNRVLWMVQGQIQPPRRKLQPEQIAVPLITQKNLLGVLRVWREPAQFFSAAESECLEGLAANAALAMEIQRQVAIKKWRFEQLALVRSVSSQLTRLQNLDEFCRQVARLIQETFETYLVSIFTVDPVQKTITHRASASQIIEKKRKKITLNIEYGDGIIGSVAATGNEIVAQQIQSESRFRPISGIEAVQSEVALPIKNDQRILGVLDLQSDDPNAFHKVDLTVLRAIADHIAFAIEEMQLVNGLEKRTQQISALLNISHALTSILDFDQLLVEVVQSIQDHFGYPYVHIFILHPGRKILFYEAGSGARSEALEQNQVAYPLDDPHGIIPWVARTGKTLLANDVSQEPLYRPSDLPPSNTRSELAIPLEYAGEVLGVLDLQSDRMDSFDIRDIPLLETLGSTIAIAIRNARLYRSEVWRRQVADSIRDIAGLVSANVALENLLDRILSELDRSLPCDATAIWLLPPNKGHPFGYKSDLILAAVHGANPDDVWKVLRTNPSARDYLMQALDATAPIIRKPEDPIGPLGTSLEFSADYSSIAAPLRAGDEPLGILTLAHRSPGRYGSQAGQITITFANHAAVAIQNNRLFSAAQEQAWISTILLQIAEATQGNQNAEDLLDTMARLTPLLVGVKKCAFFIWDENRQIFYLQSFYGLPLDTDSLRVFDLTASAFSALVESRETLFIQNPSQELHLEQAGLDGEANVLVLLPLLARGRLIGAFLVGYSAETGLQYNHIFDQQTLDLLQGIARQTALAMENLQLIEARQEEAYVTAVMLQVAQAVVSQNNLDDILDTIVHLMPILVGIDSCVIYLWEEHLEIFRTTQVFTGSQREELLMEGETFRPGEFPLLDAVRENDRLVACKLYQDNYSIENWQQLTNLITADEIEHQYTPQDQWILGIPLSIKGQFYGVMVASESNVPISFHDRRLEILAGIAQQVSLALQNDHLNREMIQRERLEREIQLARQIQKTFLPHRLPRVSGCEVAIHWQTAREVGGDFYDVFRIAKDRLGIVIADVSDKGMPAALYMTVTRTLIRAFSQKAESPARVLERVNRSLVFEAQNGLFVTVVFVILDTQTGVLTYANAGHNLPLIRRNSNGNVEPLPKGGTALGVYSVNKIKEYPIQIEPGDWIVFYTDGVTESFSSAGEIFGEERLKKIIETAPCSNSSEFIDHIRNQLSDFREGIPPSDDLTLVVLHHQGASEPF